MDAELSLTVIPKALVFALFCSFLCSVINTYYLNDEKIRVFFVSDLF